MHRKIWWLRLLTCQTCSTEESHTVHEGKSLTNLDFGVNCPFKNRVCDCTALLVLLLCRVTPCPECRLCLKTYWAAYLDCVFGSVCAYNARAYYLCRWLTSCWDTAMMSKHLKSFLLSTATLSNWGKSLMFELTPTHSTRQTSSRVTSDASCETYTCRDMKGWISLQLHAVTMMSIYLPDDQPWLCKSLVAGCASRWVEHHKYTMKEEPVCSCSNSRTGSQTGGRGLCVYVYAVGVVWWAWFVNVLVIVGRGFVYGWACFMWNLQTCL